jgi:hypothetical protein
MGTTYANLTVLGAGREAVVRALRGAPAFVAPPEHGATVVFPADEVGAAATAERLSSDLACPVLGAHAAPDGALLVELWAHGVLVHRSRSPHRPGEPDPSRLVLALGRGDATAAQGFLDHPDAAGATARHAALVGALGLPGSAVGRGYRDLAAAPEHARPAELAHVP